MKMRTEKLIIGFPSYTAMGRVVVDSTVGAWDAVYPASNALTLPLSYVARSIDTNPASSRLLCRFPEPLPAGLITIVGHNGARDAIVRLTRYIDPAATEVLDVTEADLWPDVNPLPPAFDGEVYDGEGAEWEDDEWWDGKPAEEDIAEAKAEEPVVRPFRLPPGDAGAVLLEITDQSNPDGYVEVGIVDFAYPWQCSRNFPHGSELGFSPRTAVQQAWGGRKVFDRQPKPRVFEASLRLPRNEALMRGHRLQRRHDLAVPVVVMPRPDDPAHWLRETVYGYLTDLDRLTYASPGKMSFALKVEGVLD